MGRNKLLSEDVGFTKTADKFVYNAPKAEYIVNPQHASAAWQRALLTGFTTDKNNPLGYWKLTNAEVSDNFTIRGDEGVWPPPPIAPEDVQIKRVAQKTGYHSGDTILLPLVHNAFSHLLIEGIKHLVPHRGIKKALVTTAYNEHTEYLLRCLGVEQVLFRHGIADDTTLFFDTLIVPKYDSGPPTPDSLDMLLGVVSTPKKYKKVYISRLDAQKFRVLLNEDDVIGVVRKYGFHVITPGWTTEENKINTVAGAEVVISPIGAGSMNILFCHNLARALYLNSGAYSLNTMVVPLACRPHSWGIMLGPEFLSYQNAHRGMHNDYVIDTQVLERVIQEKLLNGY